MIRSNGSRVLPFLTRNLLHDSRFLILGRTGRICGNFAPKNVTNPRNWLLLGLLNANLGATRSMHGTASMSSRDYYDILGVKKNATAAKIKKAYSRSAKKFLVDANNEDPEAKKMFEDVQKAYEFLEDKEIREMYDKVGHEALVNPVTNGQPLADVFPFHDNFDFKKIIFQKRMSGQDVKTKLPCKACGEQKECNGCEGNGVVFYQVYRKAVLVTIARTCSWCYGLVTNPRNWRLLGFMNGKLAGPRSIHGTGSVSSRDYYDILGVKKNATAAEITAAYRLAKKLHEDANKEDPEAKKMFKEVQKAYGVLKDLEKQEMYDQVGHEAYVNHDTNGVPGFVEIFLFRDMMSGKDVTVTKEISFMEAVQGCTKTVTFQTELPCEACGGFGFPPPGVELKKCECCMGKGMVYKQAGLMTIGKTCGSCRGGGYIPCEACKGVRVTRGRKTVQLDIAPGVDNNETLKVLWKGGAPPGGIFRDGVVDPLVNEPGDLYVTVKVSKDPLFRREGANIHVDVVLSAFEAMRGGTIQVPTLTGDVVLEVHPGTQSGQEVVLKGKGIKNRSSDSFGDQYVHYNVSIPEYVFPLFSDYILHVQ